MRIAYQYDGIRNTLYGTAMTQNEKPTVYLFCGLPAAGKTRLAKELEEEKNAARFTLKKDPLIVPSASRLERRRDLGRQIKDPGLLVNSPWLCELRELNRSTGAQRCRIQTISGIEWTCISQT